MLAYNNELEYNQDNNRWVDFFERNFNMEADSVLFGAAEKIFKDCEFLKGDTVEVADPFNPDFDWDMLN